MTASLFDLLPEAPTTGPTLAQRIRADAYQKAAMWMEDRALVVASLSADDAEAMRSTARDLVAAVAESLGGTS